MLRILLPLVMAWMLLLSALTMDAAAQACRLFVTSVLPGLFPYMTLSLMLTSRFGEKLPGWLFLLLGWGGGSPTGARLLPMVQGDGRKRVRLAVSTATMSPMFLLGTVGSWLGDAKAGAIVLGSVLLGGYLTGLLAGMVRRDGEEAAGPAPEVQPMSFGGAIDLAARTMLLVCGTMVMFRVFAALVAHVLPGVALPLTTVLEVTTGVEAIAHLPLPLALRTAVIAGATGFGGMASILQNRTVYDTGFLSLGEQIAWQAVHGAVSFLLALGAMWMTGG